MPHDLLHQRRQRHLRQPVDRAPNPRGLVRHPSAEHHQLQLEMGEAVAHQPRAAFSSLPRPAPGTSPRSRPQGVARQSVEGNSHHSAQQPFLRPAAQQYGAVAADGPEDGAMAQRPCPPWASAPGRLSPRSPLARARQSSAKEEHGFLRPADHADRGAQIHHRLGEIPGALLGVRPLRPAASSGLAAGSGFPRRRAARPPARHCRRPRRRGRRRWPRSPPPYRAPMPGRSAQRRLGVGKSRRPVPRHETRRDAGCGPGRNSRGPPRRAAPRRARPAASAATLGQRCEEIRGNSGPTVTTVVCCSMISESQTR